MGSYLIKKMFQNNGLKFIPQLVKNNEKFIHTAYPERLSNLNVLIRENISRHFGNRLLHKDEHLKKEIQLEIDKFITLNEYKFEGYHIKKKLIQEITNSLVGWGVLEPLINDESIQEIAVIKYNHIIIKKMFESGWLDTDIKFQSEYEAKIFVDNILSPIGRRVDKLNPIEDARLSDGSRLAISLVDISLNGLSFNIRKFPKEEITIDKLIKYQTIDENIAEFLHLIVKGKLNTMISGGTASGKTTFLNILLNLVDEKELIITLEDNAELQIKQPLKLQFEQRKANIEGKGEVSLDYILKHVLRRTPDRLVVGEIRGNEASTLMNAMATGHDGVMSSVHADDPHTCWTRTSQLASKGDRQSTAEEYQRFFGQRVNLIIQLKNLNTGVKKLTHITASIFDYKNNTTKLIDIIKWDFDKSKFIQINPLPKILVEKMLNNGVKVKKIKNSFFRFDLNEGEEDEK
ncbi:CpaF family protein (plasmid) [Mycoplasmatota bacterium]|nr:CpaF family protein [Mycoplasmatota bacterium]